MSRNASWVVLVLLAVAALFWPDTAALGHYWLGQDANAQTGILIAVLSGFLLWRAHGRFERIAIGPVTWACLPLIACAAGSLICWRAGIPALQLIFLPPILWLALLSTLGCGAARVAGFAIGFLYFALPGWKVLAPALQHLTAWAVRIIGPCVGLPVAISGMTISLPGGVVFTIEPACSGIDFLTVGLAIAALYGELEHATLRRRAGLLGGMLLVAIVSNWLRVLLILEIGYHSQMRSALATRRHVLLGWVVFACVLLLFVWVAGRTSATERAALVAGGADGDRFARATALRRPPDWRHGTVVTALVAVPALATRRHVALGWVVFACVLLLFVWVAGRTSATERAALVAGGADGDRLARAIALRRQAAWRYGAVVTALVAVPALVYGGLLATEARAGAAGFALPAGRAPWDGPKESGDSLWQPKFVGAQAERRAFYRSMDGRVVEVVAVGFPQQTQGAQILNEGNSLLGNHGLTIEAVTLFHGAGIPHGEVVALDPRGRRSVVWSIIDVGGHLFGEPLSSQLWYGARSLIGTPYSALFALRAPCDGSCDAARAALADFLRANGSALFASLPDSAGVGGLAHADRGAQLQSGGMLPKMSRTPLPRRVTRGRFTAVHRLTITP